MRASSCHIVILLTLLLPLTGCHRNSTIPALDRAEALMEQHPDSSLMAIDSIDPALLRSEAQRARYALLKSMALDKNYIDLTSDSLIGIAIRYYDTTNDNTGRMIAHFYMGRVKQNARQYSDAMPHFATTLDLASASDDDYWCARANEAIANNYAETYNYAETLPYRHQAIKHYIKAGRQLHAVYNYSDLAYDYLTNKDYARALALTDSIASVALSQLNDTSLYATCINLQARIYYRLNDYDKAIEMADTVERLSHHLAQSSTDMAIRSIAESCAGHPQQAAKYAAMALNRSATHLDSTYYYLAMINYYNFINQPMQSYPYLQIMIDRQNQIINQAMMQTSLASHRDYYHSVADETKVRLRQSSMLATIALLGIALVTVLALWVYYYKRRQAQHYLDEAVRLADRIKSMEECEEMLFDKAKAAEASCNDNNELRSLITNIFKNKLDRLHSLLAENFETGISAARHKAILKEIKEIIQRLQSPVEIKLIEELVQVNCPGIKEELASKIPALTPSECSLYVLCMTPLTVDAICFLMGISHSNYYTRKGRLKSKIRESQHPEAIKLLKPLD